MKWFISAFCLGFPELGREGKEGCALDLRGAQVVHQLKNQSEDSGQVSPAAQPYYSCADSVLQPVFLGPLCCEDKRQMGMYKVMAYTERQG